jgi:hypothetical protein
LGEQVTGYTFTDVEVPKEPEPDAVPPTVDVEYPCIVCGRESGPYGGRGRKPRRCPEHKGRTVSAPRVKGTNASLAAEATEALVQLNGFAAVGAMMIGYHATAGAIAERETLFREQAYSALLTDPALCRTILKGGTTSGKVALVIAYTMFIGGVAPYTISEYRERKAEKVSAIQDEDS